MNRYEAGHHLRDAALERWLDGEFAPVEADAARRHLADCATCRREERRYRALFLDLAAFPIPPIPADFDARILAAILPRPTADAVLVRLAARTYLAVSVFLFGFLGTLFVVSATRGGSVQGTAASGLSRAVDWALAALAAAGDAVLSILISIGNSTGPVLTALRPLVNGLGVAAEAVLPSVAPVLLVAMFLATLVLVWATQKPRHRGVPNVAHFI